MTKNHRNLTIALFAMTILAVILLSQEIKNFNSINIKPVDQPLVSDESFDIKINPNDFILGNPGAQNTVVEYADLYSARGKELHKKISDFVIKHPRDIRLVLKHSPLHRWFGDATLAHQAAYCAGLQKKSPTPNSAPQPMLWNFIDNLITKKYNLKESGLRKAAADTGINVEQWWTCTNSDQAKNAIQNNINEAVQLQAGEPPLIFINNKKINISLDFDLDDILSSAIQK